MEDLTERAREMQPGVAERVRFLEEYMARADEPEQPVGGQCFYPCPRGLFGYCGLDTLAMVRVWQKLVEAVRG